MNNERLIHLGARMKISPKNIVMLKADINYTFVYLEDGSTFMTATTIGILEDRLRNLCFFRPNRSTVINLKYMRRFEIKPLIILMENQEAVSISRRKRLDFIEIIEKHKLS
jgi:DNA-binding LytR/AlgR family response regulator